MFQVEILWGGNWIVLQQGFRNRMDAEWAIARWNQMADCRKGPFRCVESKQSVPLTHPIKEVVEF